MDRFDEQIELLIEGLGRVEAALTLFVKERTVKDWYSTEEVSQILGNAEFTVREWCRLGRMKAEKRRSGRGPHPAWVISHTEVLRYQREGLIPLNGRPVA